MFSLALLGRLGVLLGASEGGSGLAGFSGGVRSVGGLPGLRGAFFGCLVGKAGGGGLRGVLTCGRKFRGRADTAEGGEYLGFGRAHVL